MLEDSDDDLSDLISEVLIRFLTIFCAFLSILGVFSGLPNVRIIKEQRSVRTFRFLPYLTGQIYNLIWFYYGLLKLDWTVMISHTMGCTMQTFYMLVYIQYANPPPLMQICLGWMVLFFGWFHLNIIIGSRDAVIARLGFIGALSLGLVHLATLFEFITLQCINKSNIMAAEQRNQELQEGKSPAKQDGISTGEGWRRLKRQFYYMPSLYRSGIQRLSRNFHNNTSPWSTIIPSDRATFNVTASRKNSTVNIESSSFFGKIISPRDAYPKRRCSDNSYDDFTRTSSTPSPTLHNQNTSSTFYFHSSETASSAHSYATNYRQISSHANAAASSTQTCDASPDANKTTTTDTNNNKKAYVQSPKVPTWADNPKHGPPQLPPAIADNTSIMSGARLLKQRALVLVYRLWNKTILVLPIMGTFFWTWYGYLIDDFYIITPYGIGLGCELFKWAWKRLDN